MLPSAPMPDAEWHDAASRSGAVDKRLPKRCPRDAVWTHRHQHDIHSSQCSRHSLRHLHLCWTCATCADPQRTASSPAVAALDAPSATTNSPVLPHTLPPAAFGSLWSLFSDQSARLDSQQASKQQSSFPIPVCHSASASLAGTASVPVVPVVPGGESRPAGQHQQTTASRYME
ncbi:hypothetical protein BC831DRAFT_253169 [Entophlyctis helioformis]|nr:hypothetical protein BC831DRAFT_253169 [Entophlyctis helioformis]